MVNAQLSVIVAVARNGAIGRGNRLLWHISEDLQYFKQLTWGHPVVMGRKTFESIGRPLPGRTNIVLSRTLPPRAGIITAPDLASAIAACPDTDELFVIGGGSVYREALPLAHRIYLTEVHADYAADTFFPPIDPAGWREVSRRDFPHGTAFDAAFSFVVYERRYAQ
ncbi:MAG: dihydrofolate reductase [Prevotellaceae bacterium]|jgi:dihydrofolate reductase|nr:dihydrofolate reductase [Prevotellaceae bacterium]